MKFYFLNWVQLSYDFGKVVPSGTTQGKVCRFMSKLVSVTCFLYTNLCWTHVIALGVIVISSTTY
jgi:hypothetical protein